MYLYQLLVVYARRCRPTIKEVNVYKNESITKLCLCPKVLGLLEKRSVFRKVNRSCCNWIGTFTYLGQGIVPYNAIDMDFIGMIRFHLKRKYKSALDIVVALCLIVNVMTKWLFACSMIGYSLKL